MPNQARISGVLQDAQTGPIEGGKVIATLIGSDFFENGIEITTKKVEATTDASGAWTLDLIVNGEGSNGTTTWTIERLNQYAESLAKDANLFVPLDLDISFSDLKATSAQNIKAAKDASLVRLIIVNSFSEYDQLPANQKRLTDHVTLAE